MIKKQHP
jgi:hypothetical protein